MSYRPYNSRLIPPRGRKRKERDDGSEPLGSFLMPPPTAPAAFKPPNTTAPSVSSNQLLAGYMAYEFMTRGTLLGQEWSSAEARRGLKPARAEPVKDRKARSGESGVQDKYAEVASILKTEGTHIPGIVNPTQLARWVIQK